MDYRHAAVLTDLDGTLFNSQGAVSPVDRAAIRDFIDGGGLFALATGREPRNALQFLPDLPVNGPSIVLNGAAVYDFVGQRYLVTHLMDRQAAFDLLRRCQALALPLDMQVYTTDGIVYVTPLERADPGFLRIHQPTSYLPVGELGERGLFKLVLLERSPGALASMRDYLRESRLEDRIDPVEGTTDVVKVGCYQELLASGINKGSAVADLRALPIYAGRTLFAVGDYWNDMEMLRAVDVPCAPDNAIDEIKAVCSHVLPSHNDGAIARLIREVIPGHPSTNEGGKRQ